MAGLCASHAWCPQRQEPEVGGLLVGSGVTVLRQNIWYKLKRPEGERKRIQSRIMGNLPGEKECLGCCRGMGLWRRGRPVEQTDTMKHIFS